MANVFNAKGTSYASFTIGKGGRTIFQGDTPPLSGTGTPGDIFLLSNDDNSDILLKLSSGWISVAGAISADSVLFDDTNTTIITEEDVQAALEQIDTYLADLTLSDLTNVVTTDATTDGVNYSLRYNSGLNSYELKPYSAILNSKYLEIQDRKLAGTAGGTFTTGAWQTRNLNTITSNQISDASLGFDTVSLPAGTYYVEATAPAYNVNSHKIRIQDTTNSVTLLLGSNASSTAASDIMSNSSVSGMISLATATDIQLQHYAETTQATNGFGRGTNLDGQQEIYSVIKIWKIEDTIQSNNLTAEIIGMDISNNTTTPTTSIDIKMGHCFADTKDFVLSVLFDTTLDLTNSNDMIGSLPASGTVHLWVIGDTSGTNPSRYIATNDAVGGLNPAFPTGYNKKRRIGSLVTNASSQIVTGRWNGDSFVLATPTNINSSANPGTAARTITLPSIPNGIVTYPQLYVGVQNNDTTYCQGIISSLVSDNIAPSADTSNYVGRGAPDGTIMMYKSLINMVETNTSRQIRARVSYSSANVTEIISIFGWNDFTRQKF